MPSRKGIWGLLAGLGLLSTVIAACGGGSSSSTGPSAGGAFSGGSAAIVQGQLLQGAGSAQGESVIFLVFRSALGIGLAEAAPTTPLANATMTLTGPGGTKTTKTDADGKSTFTGLQAGTYTFSVCVGTAPCVNRPIVSPSPAEITVGPADLGTINVFNDTIALSVTWWPSR